MVSNQVTKHIFATSAYTQIWPSDVRIVFAVDAYIPHAIERIGLAEQYHIVTAEPLRPTRDTFVRDHDFVDKKLQQYTKIITDRLDELHQTSYGQVFWRKALALSLLRHVSFCLDLFQVCKTHLDPAVHVCQVLDSGSFDIPRDFDDHRKIFQHTELGREQLFSVYCGLFHPALFPSWSRPTEPKSNDCGGAGRPCSPSFLARAAAWVRKPARLFKKITEKFVAMRSPRVAIIECSFSAKNTARLLWQSLGYIQKLVLPVFRQEETKTDWAARESLSRNEPDFDDFDRFVFASLKHAFPRLFVENFKSAYTTLESFLAGYAGLRWIVCEWWIGSNWSALMLAVAKRHGIRHLYNEHNYYGHPFEGNNLQYLLPLVDKFATLGWADPSVSNLIPGASLYERSDEVGPQERSIDLLFISSVPNVYSPEINSSYGESGAAAVKSYLDFNRRFLGALSEVALAEVYFRAYPASIAKQCLVWDQWHELRQYMDRVKVFDDSSNGARALLGRARLVVVNYMSTSYIEALLANVPTVILWNPNTYYIRPEFASFLEPLIRVGICRDNPVHAAEFVESIKGDPELWWTSRSVQEARQQFLQTNFGNPETMIELLRGLANGGDDGS